MESNRREFLKQAVWGLLGAALVAKSSWISEAFAAAFRTPAPANAADPGKPGPAAAQKYVHFNTEFKGKGKGKPPGDSCKNCSFFKPKNPGDAWGACAMVGMKQVYEAGLCQAWAKKPGT